MSANDTEADYKAEDQADRKLEPFIGQSRVNIGMFQPSQAVSLSDMT